MPNKNKIVLSRLAARRSGQKDDYKIGLILEGGGMRGAFSAGSAAGLEKLGLRKCFDYIYASSSGSCAGAFLLSGDAISGSAIYSKELSGFRFIKPWRINKIMDIDYLCNDVFKKIHPLNEKALRESKSILKIFVSDAESGQPYCYTNHDKVDTFDLLKASCALPVYYNKSVYLDGTKLVDGNVAKRLPIEEAITDGCTDILIITTVPESYREPKATIDSLLSAVLIPFTKSFGRGYVKAYKKRKDDYNESLDIVFGVKKMHRKVHMYTISPDKLVQTGEIRAKALSKLTNDGISKLLEAFERVNI